MRLQSVILITRQGDPQPPRTLNTLALRDGSIESVRNWHLQRTDLGRIEQRLLEPAPSLTDKPDAFGRIGYVRGESFARTCELSLVDDVVAVKDAAGLMAGKQHRNTFRHSSTDKITGSSPTAIVKDAVSHAGLPTDVAPRGLPSPDGHAVACAQRSPALVDSLQARGMSATRSNSMAKRNIRDSADVSRFTVAAAAPAWRRAI